MKRKLIITLIHAFIGWFLCAATMGIGMATTSLENTLVIHAIGAPIFFSIISYNFFKKYNFWAPINTALFFVSFVILVDLFVVALIINKSLDMFTSLLGTWIPFLLIFFSTYFTGLLVNKKHQVNEA